MVTRWRISSAYRNPHTRWQHHAALTGGMTYREPARTTTRWIPEILVAGLPVAVLAIAAALGNQVQASSRSRAASPTDVLRREHRGALGEPEGADPDGTTMFDDGIPSVASHDRALLGALRQAATDVADD